MFSPFTRSHTMNLEKKLLAGGLLLSILIAGSKSFGEDKITSVDKPATDIQNTHYQGNRAPLKPASFIKLPMGHIKPKGWILKLLELQKDGLCGHLGEISAWLEKDNNAWLSTGGKYGWEEVPYWLRGYSDMAFILEDPEMKKEAMFWIDAILASQKENGWFGPEIRHRGNLDFWSNMLVLFTLQNYYEYSKDQRVLDFMTKYFRFEASVPDDQFLTDYWEDSRGGDNLYSVYWLYNITGEAWLLELAEKIHRCTANWMQQSTLPNWHNVNIAQCFREPATYAMQSGKPEHLQASYNNYLLIRRTFGQASGGMFGADENARMGYIDPRQGTETCGFAEQMTSDGILVRITGDTLWADNCEDILFNSFPAAFMPDMKALRYITSPNMVLSDGKNHHPGIDNSGPFLMMNPFSSRCCQHNHGHALPYYIQNMIMASNDNGVAVVMYNACEAKAKVGDGTEITLKEETKYPFDDTVKITVSSPKNVTFPLYLRVPGWCKNAVLWINDQMQDSSFSSGSYIRIEREWKDGDTVALKMPMNLSFRLWQVNQYSVSINYGPLTFSLKIKEDYVQKDSVSTAMGDSQWQKSADPSKWPSFEIHPGSDWNYALLVNRRQLNNSFEIVKKDWPEDNYPFRADSVPIEIQAKGQKVPSWTIDQYGLCAPLPTSPISLETPVDNITLIPMGAARLRITSFPVSAQPIQR